MSNYNIITANSKESEKETKIGLPVFILTTELVNLQESPRKRMKLGRRDLQMTKFS
jgi:hypothetical protein